MAGVAEHNAEQEGKRDDGVERRVGLAIRRHAVHVYQILKALRKPVRPVERRRIFIRVDHIEEGRYGASAQSLKKRKKKRTFPRDICRVCAIFIRDLSRKRLAREREIGRKEDPLYHDEFLNRSKRSTRVSKF